MKEAVEVFSLKRLKRVNFKSSIKSNCRLEIWVKKNLEL